MEVSTAALHVCSAAAVSASAVPTMGCSFMPAKASSMACCRDLGRTLLRHAARIGQESWVPDACAAAGPCTCILAAEAAVERRSSEWRGAWVIGGSTASALRIVQCESR